MQEHAEEDIKDIPWRCPPAGRVYLPDSMPPLPAMNEVMVDSLKWDQQDRGGDAPRIGLSFWAWATCVFGHLLLNKEFPKSEPAKHALNKRPLVFLRWLETRVPGMDESMRVQKDNGPAPRGLNAVAMIQEPAARADGRSTRG